MKQFKTYEEFLNESYTRKFGNFQVALAKEKIEGHWLDEMSEASEALIKLVDHFGKTPHKDIMVIFEKDNKEYEKVRDLVRRFGIMALFGLDLKNGRFCVINSNS